MTEDQEIRAKAATLAAQMIAGAAHSLPAYCSRDNFSVMARVIEGYIRGDKK